MALFLNYETFECYGSFSKNVCVEQVHMLKKIQYLNVLCKQLKNKQHETIQRMTCPDQHLKLTIVGRLRVTSYELFSMILSFLQKYNMQTVSKDVQAPCCGQCMKKCGQNCQFSTIS